MNNRTQELFVRFQKDNPALQPCFESVVAAYALLCKSYEANKKLLCCGNGGSACDAEHIVGELMKGFLLKRPVSNEVRESLSQVAGEHGEYLANHLQGALPALSLVSHPGLSTAFGNDVAGDMVFAQQVFGYGVRGDSFLGISTSGNAQNVVNAALLAKANQLATIGMTGSRESRLSSICDICIRVPAQETYRVQEYHLAIYHALCAMLESTFFEK